MSDSVQPTTVLCNGASPPGRKSAIPRKNHLALDYRGKNPRVVIQLPAFVQGVVHLPDRVLDLLELAAYLFAADRSLSRGDKDALEYLRWSRHFKVVMKVRDHAFWRKTTVQSKLAELLQFMSGDRQYDFKFQPGHSTPVTSLFDKEDFSIASEPNAVVAWFSGGLDSLAGLVDVLTSSDSVVYPVSHQSGLSATIRTQNRLTGALNDKYQNRVRHYKFRTHLHGERAAEETQRTRAFLYAVISFALATTLKTGRMTAFENGVTAINFARRADLLNARATRTAHPKTIWLMREFFSEILGEVFQIETPYLWKTKTDVVRLIAERKEESLITSACSCSKTFKNLGPAATHCGGCSQCIDRRFAAFASGLNAVDESAFYAHDFLTQPIDESSVRTTLVDYVRQAKQFADWSINHFQRELMPALTDIVGFAGIDDNKTIECVYELCHRHGEQVGAAIQSMRQVYDHPFHPPPVGSFLKIINAGEHLAETDVDYEGLIDRLSGVLPGNESADDYEKLVRQILCAAFDPDLKNAKAQQEMDNGRKRIDITFENHAKQGFFARLQNAHRKRCPWIVFECKNYTDKIGNPEFDQLAGRLMKGPTKVGFIVCRKIADKGDFLQHCIDRSSDGDDGILMLVLDDDDLSSLLRLRSTNDLTGIADFLEEKLRAVSFRTKDTR